MKITAQQYGTALYEALSTVRPEDRERVMDNFVKLLSENGATSMYQEIKSEFLAHEQKAKGIIPVTVTTANDAASRKTLDHLNELVGRDTAIKQKLDSSLIGGVLIETEDTRIDASVRTQLRDLKDQLSK